MTVTDLRSILLTLSSTGIYFFSVKCLLLLPISFLLVENLGARTVSVIDTDHTMSPASLDNSVSLPDELLSLLEFFVLR